MRNRLYPWLAHLVSRRPGQVLTVCALFTVAMIFAAGRLGMKTQIADMMPPGIPQIEEFMEIVEQYSSASSIMITVESAAGDEAAMQACADDLAGRIAGITLVRPHPDSTLSLGQRIAVVRGKHPVPGVSYDTLPLVDRIDYRADNVFFATHGMIIQNTSDLETMLEMYGGLGLPELLSNINDNFEKEFIGDSDNLTSLDGERQAVAGLQGIGAFLASIGTYLDRSDSTTAAEAAAAFLTGTEYLISSDNTLLLMMLKPAVSLNEFEEVLNLGYQIDDTLAAARERYPELAISRSGAIMMQIDENNALADDFGWPSLAALALILILLIGSFRTWKNPFFSVVTLAIAIIWVTGILALMLRYLTMMSASFGIVLVGLGIDFGIHFISGFRDGREQGMDVEGAIRHMFERVGPGVVTGAMTTAIVFFSLSLTGFKAFTQMGVATGTGILITLAAMMVLLPALIAWDNKGYSVTGSLLRRLGLRRSPVRSVPARTRPLGKAVQLMTHPLQFGFLSGIGGAVSHLPIALVVLAVSAVLVVVSLNAARHIEFEYDMMEMQPQGTLSLITQNNILDRFEISPDYAMVRARTLDECRDLTRRFKELGNRTGLIGQVDAVSEFIPAPETQQANIVLIEQFRNRLAAQPVPVSFSPGDRETLARELERIHANIVEIGELSVMSSGEDNKIIRTSDRIAGRSDDQSTILPLAARIREAAPETLAGYQRIVARTMKERLLRMAGTEMVTLDNLPTAIRERYVHEESGDLLITVFPKGYIWDQNSLRRFNDMTSAVSERITGMPLMVLLMIDMMQEKGTQAIILGALAIAVFLLIDFRSVKFTVIAMLPLAIGVSLMLGLIALAGLKFDLANFMALPLIIGIGIDDGVHILHRYRLEGPGSLRTVITYTGRAILLTSLTTIIGFGSMALASHKGIAGMGAILVMGVGACFVSSAVILPALLTLLERVPGPFGLKPLSPR